MNGASFLMCLNKVCGYDDILLESNESTMQEEEAGEEASERNGLRRFLGNGGAGWGWSGSRWTPESGHDRVDAGEAELGGAASTVLSLSNGMQRWRRER
ncbi:unnamed protein product [Linum trigynum]|uniref:Uncharacterized protein n=1 Tax=Linum trigynum TaxID=586398 RepID=A0AAV2GP46_9ROSI